VIQPHLPVRLPVTTSSHHHPRLDCCPLSVAHSFKAVAQPFMT